MRSTRPQMLMVRTQSVSEDNHKFWPALEDHFGFSAFLYFLFDNQFKFRLLPSMYSYYMHIC